MSQANGQTERQLTLAKLRGSVPIRRNQIRRNPNPNP